MPTKDKPETKHPLSATAIEARCPDCHSSLAIPVMLHGLDRNDDGERILELKVQDEVFEPYIRRHLALSDHPILSETVGEDWTVDDNGQPLDTEDDKA